MPCGFVLDLAKAFSRLPRAAFVLLQKKWFRSKQVQLWVDFFSVKQRDLSWARQFAESLCPTAVVQMETLSPPCQWHGSARLVAAQGLDNRSFQSFCYADNLKSLTRSAKDTRALINASLLSA